MRLDSSGNLGLGVTPSNSWTGKAFQLGAGAFTETTLGGEVAYNAIRTGTTSWNAVATGNSNRFSFGGGAFAWHIGASTPIGDAISFTQAMTLVASGNLLIGTTTESGSGRLRVVDSVRIADSSTETNALLITTTASAATIETRYATPIVLGVGAVEAARIDSSGNLLVGTTNPAYATDKLAVVPTSGNATGIGIAVGNFNSVGLGVYNGYTATGTATAIEFKDHNSVTRGSITVTTTGTLYNITSDYRLKTVVGPVAGSGQRIDALQPVEYTWKENGASTRGFLAHQFQEVYASSVSGTKDAVDAEGKPVYQSMQASTSEVIADLVAELQSLRARVAALESI
jgi:hypothetical protein